MKELVSLLPLVGIVLLFWLLVLRPAQNRARKLNELQSQLLVGDRVVLGAGIAGTVRRIGEGESVSLEIADGVVIEVMRSAIVARVEPEDRIDPDEPRKSL